MPGTLVDPTHPILIDHPPEWRVPTEEELIVAGERDRYGNLTPAAKAMYDRLALDRWYLVRNDHKIRVRGQSKAATYITRLGVEYPVYGLDGAWRLYTSVVKHDADATGEHVDSALKAFRLGAIVPITIEKARELYDRTAAKVPQANTPRATEILLGPRPGGWA